jgi:hypothetical protein
MQFVPKCGLSQQSRNPKLKDKYFVSVMSKLQFAVSSGKNGHVMLKQVGGMTLSSLHSYLCDRNHAFSTDQIVFTVECHFRKWS